jgi:hypothetical protein
VPRYWWSVPVMLIAGLLCGRFLLGAGWGVALLDGVLWSLLFNGAFWFSGHRSRKRRFRAP